MSIFKTLFIVALILALIGTGCATPATYSASGDASLQTATAGGQSQLALCKGHPAKHQKVGDKTALYVLAGFLIATVVVIDLLILPFTYSDPFPCARGVIHLCH